MTIDLALLFVAFGINAIAALGFYFTLSSGQFSIAHGALYAIGGYSGGYAVASLGLPFPLAVLLGGVVAATVGAFVAVLLARVRGLYFAVATLAFGVVAMEAVKRVPGMGGPYGLGGVANFSSAVVVACLLLVVIVLVWRFDKSPLYVAHAASRFDQDGALVMGIDVARTRGVAFAVGGGIAGMAGVLYAGMTTIVSPADGGFAQSLAFLLMVVIGGAGTWRGPVLGAAIWTALPEFLRATAEWRMIIFGVAAIALMAWRPQGLIPRQLFAGTRVGPRGIPKIKVMSRRQRS